MASDYIAREYRPADEPMIAGWWQTHRGTPFPAKLLPPVGVVVEKAGEPVAACWLYMAVGIGVCWLEYPIAKPGMGLAGSRAAFKCSIDALEAVAKTHDYGLMIAHTLPAIARVMEGFGFQVEERGKVAVVKLVQ